MTTERQVAGELALEALTKLVGAAALGSFVYQVREREGAGWEGPHVRAWSDGCKLVTAALTKAGITVAPPFPKPPVGQVEEYYVFPRPADPEADVGEPAS